ncbi:MAG: sensor domain-containing diguanylate cyclase [Erysipelotrichaceae bacterium]
MDINNQLTDVLENLFEGVYMVDQHRTILSWNKGAEQITGFSSADVVNKKCYANILNHVDDHGVALCFAGCPLHATMGDGRTREATVYLQHKNGHRIPIKIKTLPLTNELNEVSGAIEIFSEIRDEHQLISKLEHFQKEASEDALTKVPNRKYMAAIIESKIREYNTVDLPFGILFLDIDDFKHVNDTYGHENGDEVLKMLAKTIKSILRKNDYLGRWGGEEFIIAFSDVDQEGLEVVSKKILSLVEASKLRHTKNEIGVTISIGATMSIPHDTVSSIVKRADELMYASKTNGKNQVTLG